MRGKFTQNIVRRPTNESKSHINGLVKALGESQTRNMIMTKGFVRRLNAVFEADDLKRHTGWKEGREKSSGPPWNCLQLKAVIVMVESNTLKEDPTVWVEHLICRER